MANCTFLRYETNKKCNICAPGFYFNTTKCVPCNAGEGCAVCDYRTPSLCLTCKDGF